MTSFSPIFPETAVGIGTFPFASPFSTATSAVSADVLREYLVNGGKCIDTAPTYDFGRVESLVGSVVSRFPRESVFINTSCGWVRKGDDFVLSGARDDVLRSLDGSLERLQVDYIDSYISHRPDPVTPFSDTMQGLLEAKASGRVRHIGVSNVTLEQLESYCQNGPVEIVQNRLSLINRSFSDEFLKLCRGSNVAIAVYQVIERGLLTDRDDASIIRGAGDLRSRKPEFSAGPRTVIRQWVRDSLRPIAHHAGTSTPALAIQWAACQPGVALVQCGASNVAQARTLQDARELVLDEATLREIEDAYAELTDRVQDAGYGSVRHMMGLGEAEPLAGASPSGR